MMTRALAMLAGLSILLIAGVAVAMMARRRPDRRVTQPICGECGYAVEGLPTFTCPECGSDLRKVGIITPRRASRRLGAVGAAVRWTLTLAVAATLITVVLAATLLPNRVIKHSRYTLTPASGAYASVDCRARGEFLQWPWQPGRQPRLDVLTLTLTTLDGERRSLRIDLEPKSSSQGESSPGELPEYEKYVRVIADWMAEAAIDVRGQPVQFEIMLLAATLARCGRDGELWSPVGGGEFTLSASGSGVRTSTVYWSVPMLVFWVAVWLVGLWLIVRRSRVRGLDSPPAT